MLLKVRLVVANHHLNSILTFDKVLKDLVVHFTALLALTYLCLGNLFLFSFVLGFDIALLLAVLKAFVWAFIGLVTLQREGLRFGLRFGLYLFIHEEHVLLGVKLEAVWIFLIILYYVPGICILCDLITKNEVICGHVQVFLTISLQVILQIGFIRVHIFAIDLRFSTLEFNHVLVSLLRLFGIELEMFFSELGVFLLEVGFNFIVDIVWAILSVIIKVYFNLI